MMYLPSTDDERTTLRNYIKTQAEAVRDAAYGLDDEALRSTPLASSLSLGGLMYHCAYVMSGPVGAVGHDNPFDGIIQPDTFTMPADMTGDDLRAFYDDLTRRYLEVLDEADLDQVMPMGPMPWFGMDEPRDGNLRYLVVHHVEELARHAGHADIIREQIDGAQSGELLLAVEGQPANDFVQPWQPKG